MLDENNLEDYDEFERADKFIDDQMVFDCIQENHCICCNAIIEESGTMCEECKEHSIECFE